MSRNFPTGRELEKQLKATQATDKIVKQHIKLTEIYEKKGMSQEEASQKAYDELTHNIRKES